MPVCLLAATPATAQDAASVEPRNTPGLPAELRPIDDMLTGGLLNDPTDLNWTTYGASFSRELIVDESYPGGGAALRVINSRPGEAYAGGLNIPLLARTDAGDTLTVGFFARTIESAAEDGKGRVFVRFQQNREPYPGFGDTTLQIGPEWNFYEVTTRAERSLRDEGIVALQFGSERQTVEIGQAIVVSGTASVLD
ncbi:hypothetical protein D6201_10970 [Aurantiacibacter aquimixticola]|uniref:CBM-cenC domain-containing protein n=1 Tax=Aurantiacibacter aquimixticola TaxID=1958945 RepID=A0A419RVI7_9SPHN|nr:hypothetical protein D6201_10970 [Aurantiacibacter aquimixticola]